MRKHAFIVILCLIVFVGVVGAFEVIFLYPGGTRAAEPATPKNRVTMTFARRGKVAAVLVRAGEGITQGRVLAKLDTKEYNAQLGAAQALVALQERKLTQIQQVLASPASDQYKVDAALDAIRNSQRIFVNTLRDAYVRADDAVRGKSDQFFIRPYQLNVVSSDSQLTSDISGKRTAIERALTAWKNIPLPATPSENDSYETTAVRVLGQVIDFLDALAIAVNGQVTDPTLTVFRNQKSDLFTARSNVIAAEKNLITANQGLKDAQFKYMQVSQVLKVATKTGEGDATVQQAQLEDVRARLAELEAQSEQFILQSPVAGKVAEVYVVEGMNVSPGSPAVSIER